MAKHPTLWGPGELCSGLKISRPTLKAWRELADFPKPIAELGIGSVWDAAEVKAWHKRRRSGPQPALGTKRKGTSKRTSKSPSKSLSNDQRKRISKAAKR